MANAADLLAKPIEDDDEAAFEWIDADDPRLDDTDYDYGHVRCVALERGRRCTDTAVFVRLCARHWRRVRELHQRGETLWFVDTNHSDFRQVDE